MRSQSSRQSKPKKPFVIAPCVLALATLGQPAFATIDIPTAPLQSAAAIPSNILFLLDDSGSMQFEVMPDDLMIWPSSTQSRYGVYLFPPPSTTNVYGSGKMYGSGSKSAIAVPSFDDNNFHNYYKRSATNNNVFYDPTVTYIPWVKYDGSSYGNASPTAAPFTPVNPTLAALDLTTSQSNNTATWITGSALSTLSASLADNNYKTCGASGTSCSSSDSYYPITFYVYKGTGDKTQAANYMKYQIRGTAGYKKDLGSTSAEQSVTSFNWGSVTRTVAEETQNFANWFTYYRSRALAAKAGASVAFSKLGTNYRVGFATINNTSLGDVVPTSGVFETTNRQNWFNSMLNSPVPTSGTPLKEALDRAGQYFSRSDNTGPYGPSPQLSCRRNFTILTTDGYYNAATISGIGNEDNTNGTTITGTNSQSYTYTAANPFKDSYSNTLADIALYYWKRDLRTDLTNNLRTTSTNPSFWQNMSTFTLSLGPQGTLSPSNLSSAGSDLVKLTSGLLTWPDPTAGDAQKIDDLWHASVNGRGSFVAAKNPTEFATGLVSALNTIGEAGAGWNIAVSAYTLEVDGKSFVTRYDGTWGGDLWAVGYNGSGQLNAASDGTPTPIWKASEKLPAAASRKIFTWKDSGGGGTAFDYNNLSATKKTALGSSAVVDYLRGVTSGEVANGGTYRNRSTLIGDIANPAPVYVKASNTVFVAANDGMLHAFDGTSGVEQFAYIPGGVNFNDLKALTSPTYSHKYINDGELVVSDLSTTGKNILVGNLGRAGKTIYALDVTTPASFGNSSVLWEFTDTDLGQTPGKAMIVKLNTGDWAVVIGNGYNSANERAVLFVINLTTGALIKKIDTGAGSSSASNGLTTPVGFDQNGDGTVDYVYAGDLLGNVWKFNLSSGTTSSWAGTSLFVAKDASGNLQPITGGMSIAIEPTTNKRWIFVGTGRYLTNADVASTAVQSWYGIIDDGRTISGRSALTQRTISDPTAQGSYLTRTFSAAATNDMVGKQGWYADLITGGVASGERMISRSQYSAGVLYASSLVPSSDVCASGGSGYINAVDAFSGASLVTPFFDVNNDGLFDNNDKKTVGGRLLPAGSVKTGGMIGEITIKRTGDTRYTILSCDTTGACKSNPNVNLGSLRGRVSWREIRTE